MAVTDPLKDKELQAAGGQSSDAKAAHEAAAGKGGDGYVDQHGYSSTQGDSPQADSASTGSAGTASSGAAGQSSTSTMSTLQSLQQRFAGGSQSGSDGGSGGLGRGIANAVIKRKRAAIAAAISAAVLGAILSLLGGLLGPLKLESMQRNSERVRMARMIYLFDQRSDRFLVSMLQAEVAGNNANGENRYFVAKGWTENSNPFAKRYQRMKDSRTNSFFDDMERTQGIRFVRELSGGQDRLVRLETPGGDIDFNDLASRPGGFSASEIENFEDAVQERYESNRDARRAFRQSVRNQTKFYQVIKRYNMRKWGLERLGITRWQFFEGTRERARERMRTSWTGRISGKLLGGYFMQCLVTSKCPDSDSLSDADNAPSTDAPDEELVREASGLEDEGGDGGDGGGGGDGPSNSPGRKLAGKLVSKAIPGLNILSSVQMLVQFDDLLKSGGLVKLVSVARQTEYAASFMTLGIIADQAKEGVKLNSEEMEATMEMFDGIENSDEYTQTTTGLATASAFDLVPDVHAENEPYEYASNDNMSVGAEGTNAEKITNTYNNGPGKIISPMLSTKIGLCPACFSLGGAVKGVGGAVDAIIGPIIDTITKPLMAGANSLFSATTGKSAEELMADLMSSAVDELGGSSQCGAGESAGQKMNCIGAGAAVVQENFLLDSGMGRIPQERAVELNKLAYEENLDRRANETVWQRLASTEHGDSYLAQLILRTPTTQKGMIKESSDTTTRLASALSPSSILVTAERLAKAASSKATAESYVQAENPYIKTPHGLTDAELKADMHGGKGEADCEAEVAAYDEKLKKGERPATSLCKVDEIIGNSLECPGNNDNCAGIGGNQAPIEECEAPGGELGKVYVMGDSLMVGAENSELAERLKRAGASSVKINASGSRSITTEGEDGKTGLEAIKDDSEVKDANTIIINLGANIEPGDFKENVEKLLKAIDDRNEAQVKIYWVNIVSTGDNKYAGRNEVLSDLASDGKFTLIDAKSKDIQFGSADTIHPTPAGYKTYAQAIADGTQGESEDPSCDGGSVEGSAKELAKKLLESDKISGNQQYIDQIKQISEGNYDCNVNPDILKMLVGVTNQGLKLSISSLNRFCTGVLTDSGPGSFHYTQEGGHAVDVQAVNGVSSTGNTKEDIRYIKAALKYLPQGSELGQINCRPEKLDTPGVEQVNDSCNHVHIGVPPKQAKP